MVARPGMDRGVAVWSTPEWRESVVAWLDERLAANGIRRTGVVEQTRVQPWGTVLMAPTTAGPVWFKAGGNDTRYESALYRILVDAAPRFVLHPIAVDTDRSWLLLRDAGPPVVPKGASVDTLVDILTRALPDYAALQRALVPRVEEMLTIGVRDMRLASLPDVFEEMLVATRTFVDRHGTKEDLQLWERTAALRPAVIDGCDQLARSAILVSLDHSDLHTENIRFGPSESDPFRFYDWGDSGVAHPFTSMLVCLGVLVDYYGLALDDPRLLAARDAYLESFTDLAPLPELIEELELVCWLARIARALTWERVAAAQPDRDGVPGGFARDPFRVLSSMLIGSYLGMGGI